MLNPGEVWALFGEEFFKSFCCEVFARSDTEKTTVGQDEADHWQAVDTPGFECPGIIFDESRQIQSFSRKVLPHAAWFVPGYSQECDWTANELLFQEPKFPKTRQARPTPGAPKIYENDSAY